MSWTRRDFVVGVSLGTIITACNRAASDDKAPAPQPPAKPKPDKPAQPPAPPPRRPAPPRSPGAGDMIRPGYQVATRDDATYDGDDLLVNDGGTLVRFDGKLVERARIPVPNALGFALLSDRSLVVATLDTVHHVVKDKVVGTQEAFGWQLRSFGSAAEFWSISSIGSALRMTLGATKLDRTISLPDNTHLATAETLADGTLVINHNDGILHVDKATRMFKWNETSRILNRGPEPMSVWANVDHQKLVLAQLDRDRVVVKATHALKKGDRLVHSTSNGQLAGGIVARPVTNSQASFSLVVWDAKKERLRVPLDDAQNVVRICVMSDKRIAALTSSLKMVAFDLATGKPV